MLEWGIGASFPTPYNEIDPPIVPFPSSEIALEGVTTLKPFAASQGEEKHASKVLENPAFRRLQRCNFELAHAMARTVLYHIASETTNPLQGVQAMTQVMYKTRRFAPVAQPAERPDPAVTAVLRDAAFVLRMTRKVKDAIMDCKPLTPSNKA